MSMTEPASGPQVHDSDSVVAEVKQAVKEYVSGEGVLRALDGVDVQFPRGRFTAIMGPSGSGKSTLLHCVAGLDKLTSGTAIIDGVKLDGLSDDETTLLRRERVGFIFQAFNLVPTMSAAENITLPSDLARRRIDADWFAGLTDTVGIGAYLSRRPSELSGGQQQHVAVARALVSRPAVVFADEPTGNLDSRAGAEVLGLLRDAVTRLHQSVIMVTHDPVAASHCDRVVFLSDGRVVDTLQASSADDVLGRVKTLGVRA